MLIVRLVCICEGLLALVATRLFDRLGTKAAGKIDGLLDGVGLPLCGCAPWSEDAAAAACCWANSLREALPRFLRSRRYAHVKPNSDVMLAETHGTTASPLQKLS
jgi:hypothetical protein